MLASQIAELLARKERLDDQWKATNSLSSGAYSQWMAEAIELLLRIELERARIS